MKFYESFHCPVEWKCNHLNQVFNAGLEGYYNVNKGWLCECGHWAKKTTRLHEILLMGYRKAVKREKSDKIKHLPTIEVNGICCECNKPTDREINGVFTCQECYRYESDFITALGLAILDCSIEFNPNLTICNKCPYFIDCSTHHVMMDPTAQRKEAGFR
jgi:hypothetical protein